MLSFHGANGAAQTPGGGGLRPELHASPMSLAFRSVQEHRSRPGRARQTGSRSWSRSITSTRVPGGHQTQSSPSRIASATRCSPARMASFMRATVSRSRQPQVGAVIVPAFAAEARRPKARVRAGVPCDPPQRLMPTSRQGPGALIECREAQGRLRPVSSRLRLGASVATTLRHVQARPEASAHRGSWPKRRIASVT